MFSPLENLETYYVQITYLRLNVSPKLNNFLTLNETGMGKRYIYFVK